MRSFGIFIVAAHVLASGAAIAEENLPSGTSVDDHIGSVTRSAVWLSNEQPIDVCWENPSQKTSKYERITRAAAEETWSANSAVMFSGWGTCSSSSKGIRVQISDEGPHVKSLGRYLSGRPHGMVLNFDFENWSESCQSKVDYCVYVIAVHEFGHALGFAHEANRTDAPKECREDHHQGTTGDYDVTEYDPNSVMNYCNPQWSGNGKLSTLDIESVQLLYGR